MMLSTVFTGPTERVLRSTAYRAAVEHGWAQLTPYEHAEALCALRGRTIHDYGLYWETFPPHATPGKVVEVGVPTIPLLLALGYGSRLATLVTWIGYWRALRRVGR